MESLKVFDGSNAFIASYFTDDKGCAHCNREHTLIYLI
ncbi:MAG: AraC family transcriptional regulator, partial [Muribaculaceae bacterium]|nr:AraC family transcriptional regulator [Muribaculaceae bacterium]